MKTKKKIQKFQKRGFCLNIGRGAETRGKNRQLREIDRERNRQKDREIDRKGKRNRQKEREIDRKGKRNRQKEKQTKKDRNKERVIKHFI